MAITENEAINIASKPRHDPELPAALQPQDNHHNPEQANPCDAYMVLLQRLLKDL